MNIEEVIPVQPVSDRILVVKDAADSQTEGGIILAPSRDTDDAYWATVAAVGPGRWVKGEHGDELIKPTVEPGDRVLIAGMSVGHPLSQALARKYGDQWAFVFEDEMLAKESDQRFVIVEKEQWEQVTSKANS